MGNVGAWIPPMRGPTEEEARDLLLSGTRGLLGIEAEEHGVPRGRAFETQVLHRRPQFDGDTHGVRLVD